MTIRKVHVAVRLDAETVAFLDWLAEVEEKDRGEMIKQAIANFVELQRRQMEQIKNAVKNADGDSLATDEEVVRLFSEWTT